MSWWPFFNGHPDLAGRSTRLDGVTAEPRQEQGSAGLDGLDAATEARLLDLNRAYRERFGFPFSLAVRGKRPAEILGAMEARLRNADAQEQAEALRRVERIILSRLEDRLGGA